MKSEREQVRCQIELIREAMKHAGKWSECIPEWVWQYQSEVIPDIWQWLQFIYLPLRNHENTWPSQYLAPQVIAHARMELQTDSILLQRIVELDSLTSTLHT